MMIRPLVSIYGAPQTATKCLRKLLLNQHQLVVIILSFKSINKQLQCTQQMCNTDNTMLLPWQHDTEHIMTFHSEYSSMATDKTEEF